MKKSEPAQLPEKAFQSVNILIRFQLYKVDSRDSRVKRGSWIPPDLPGENPLTGSIENPEGEIFCVQTCGVDENRVIGDADNIIPGFSGIYSG